MMGARPFAVLLVTLVICATGAVAGPVCQETDGTTGCTYVQPHDCSDSWSYSITTESDGLTTVGWYGNFHGSVETASTCSTHDGCTVCINFTDVEYTGDYVTALVSIVSSGLASDCGEDSIDLGLASSAGFQCSDPNYQQTPIGFDVDAISVIDFIEDDEDYRRADMSTSASAAIRQAVTAASQSAARGTLDYGVTFEDYCFFIQGMPFFCTVPTMTVCNHEPIVNLFTFLGFVMDFDDFGDDQEQCLTFQPGSDICVSIESVVISGTTVSYVTTLSLMGMVVSDRVHLSYTFDECPNSVWTGSTSESSSCINAVALPPPYVDITMVGSLANRAYADDGCSPEQRSTTYHIAPTVGNDVTLKSCGAAAHIDVRLTVFTSGCSNIVCTDSRVLLGSPNCVEDSDTLVFNAEQDEYWIVVTSANGADGQFSITINEAPPIRPLPGCDIALSLFGPYSPPLELYGLIEEIETDTRGSDPPSTVPLAVIDSFDVASAQISLDGRGSLPKLSSNIAVSESLPFGSRVLTDEVINAVGDHSGTAVTSVSEGTWFMDVSDSIDAIMIVTYEMGSSALLDLTVFGQASGLRIAFSGQSVQTSLAVTIEDNLGSQRGISTAVMGSTTTQYLYINYSSMSGVSDLLSTRKIVVKFSGAGFSLRVEELAVVGTLSLPPVTSPIMLPCIGVEVTTSVLWYKIYPSQSYVTVSTCMPGSMVATDVGVYNGRCSDFVCVPSIEQSMCSHGATVEFYRRYSTNYYVSVSGRNGATGIFELQISESWSSGQSYSDESSSYNFGSFGSFGTFGSFGSFGSFGWFGSSGSFGSFGYFGSFGSFGDFGSFHNYWTFESVSSFYSSYRYTFWGYFTSFLSSPDWYVSYDDDDEGGRSCSDPIPVYHGVSAVYENSGNVYSNLCGLYTHSGSRWFVYTPTSTERVRIDVCTANFDTVLAVVDSCQSLQCLLSNDDGCGFEASYVNLSATAGRSYYIFVGGYSSERGRFSVRITSL